MRVPRGESVSRFSSKEIRRFGTMLSREKRSKSWLLIDGGSEAMRRVSAATVGKSARRTVYRVDCAKLFSKYIGETEKNIDLLLVKAKRRAWILFFDEADALFGKRTKVKDSHDHFSNVETSYLLKSLLKNEIATIWGAADAQRLKRVLINNCSVAVKLS